MIIPDVNLLVYAYHDGAPQHDAARRWWEVLLNGQESVGIPWAVAMGFVRIMTRPSLLAWPVTTVDAAGYVREWLNHSHVSVLNPGPMHLDHVERNLAAAGMGRNLVPDSHIAAIAMENEAEVHSNDGDFARFPGLSRRKDYEKIGEGHYRKMVKRNWHPAHRHFESQGMDGTTIGQS